MATTAKCQVVGCRNKPNGRRAEIFMGYDNKIQVLHGDSHGTVNWNKCLSGKSIRVQLCDHHFKDYRQ